MTAKVVGYVNMDTVPWKDDKGNDVKVCIDADCPGMEVSIYKNGTVRVSGRATNHQFKELLEEILKDNHKFQEEK